ncbi:hypothetical protein CEP51_012088 [Fusarium floridanum]|uniref:LysM domain-containing protein n=2 Tax=Fusarium solani species complex TaxID=232080 RepID=A0A428R0T9_9HYPO|nr:hypothetical protein CEP51_012088 [Fusarium floridanum]RSL95245.1 hypothetical protein CDV31_013976 [Fusarium ambrosium]
MRRGPYQPNTAQLLGIILCSFLSSVLAQEYSWSLGVVDSSILLGANQTCLDVFNANVSCAPIIQDLFENPYLDLEEPDLSAFCQNTCYSSLVSQRDRIQAECEGAIYQDPVSEWRWQPTYLVETAVLAFNITCLKRSDDSLCNIWYREGASKVENPDCDECYVMLPFLEAVLPAGHHDRGSSMYESATSSSSSSCDSQYKIQSGDTYLSVSLSQNVSTHDLITANGLKYSLKNFPASGTLCIRNQCQVYVVKDGDTCDSIQETTHLNFAELRSWNPYINGLCNNIADKVNQTICASNPLGDFSMSDSIPSESATLVPDNLAPNTTTNCSIYHEVQAKDDCSTLGVKYGIELKDFIFLNPMVWENCTNLWLNTSYCVAPVGSISEYPGYGPEKPTFDFEPVDIVFLPWEDPWEEWRNRQKLVPLATGTRKDCWNYDWWNNSEVSLPEVSSVAFVYEVNLELFLAWNPSLEGEEIIKPSVSYCVALSEPTPTPWKPPNPRAPGEPEDCIAWFPATLSCEIHVINMRMDMGTFVKLNPSVGEDCSTFIHGTWYCYQVIADNDWNLGDEEESPDGTHTTLSSTKALSTQATKTTSQVASATPSPTRTTKGQTLETAALRVATAARRMPTVAEAVR